MRLLLKAMRVHQWAKNSLLFVPLILSHNILDQAMLLKAIIAFVSFSLCASAVYIFNDILDIEADRQHPRKCKRPFAAGLLAVRTGIVFGILLISVAAVIAWQVNENFIYILAVYFIITTAYSLYIKQIVLLDVMLLAILYTTRLVAGSIAIGVEHSFWLLLFSIFIFFSLAMVKRYSELANSKADNDTKLLGRGYTRNDMPLLLSLGVVSGFSSVQVMALYIHDNDILAHYSHPQWLWMVVISVLFWVSYIWLTTFRGKMNEDPVLYASHDKLSLLVLVSCSIAVYLAL